MNKKKFSLLLAILICFSIVFPFGSNANDEIQLWINGDYVKSDVAPFIEDGRTLVPVRIISESLGKKVEWNQNQQQVTITSDAKNIVMTINENTVIVDGKNSKLEVAPKLSKERTFVPVRFIAEEFNMKVDWDDTNKTVVIGEGYLPPTKAVKPTYEVTRVVDGDTIEINYNGTKEKVRFLLIETPESVHRDTSKNVAYGKIASDYTKKLLEGKSVSLEFDTAERDRYGRLLAYVYIGDTMVNELLLSEGHAKVVVFQPNVKYVEKFRNLEAEAKSSKKGIWAEGVSAFEDKTTETSKPSEKEESSTSSTASYIGNANSKVFHRSNCVSVGKMNNSNKVSIATRDEAINSGYKPCNNCRP